MKRSGGVGSQKKVFIGGDRPGEFCHKICESDPKVVRRKRLER